MAVCQLQLTHCGKQQERIVSSVDEFPHLQRFPNC
jgi:hypothetical protein